MACFLGLEKEGSREHPETAAGEVVSSGNSQASVRAVG